MRESAAALKGQDAKRSISSKNSSVSKKNAHLHTAETVINFGPLRDRLHKLSRDGVQPSVDSISAGLADMTQKERASTIQALHRTYGNKYVQTIVSRIKSGSESKPGGEDRGGSGHQTPNSIGRKLGEVQSSGHALEPDVRSTMESSFGQNLGGVRLHTDAKAARLASDINAQAFTVGQDVFFGSGKYQPRTEHGRALLAHELTHTRQQMSVKSLQLSREGAEYAVSGSGDALEREARYMAGKAAVGLPIGHLAISSVPMEKILVSRQAADTDVVQADLDGLAAEIIMSLRADPNDHSGRAMRLIASLDPASKATVLDKIKSRVQPQIFKRLSKPLLPEAPSAEVAKKPTEGKAIEAKAAEASITAITKPPTAQPVISRIEPTKPAEPKGAKVRQEPEPRKPEAKTASETVPVKKDASKPAAGAEIAEKAEAEPVAASSEGQATSAAPKQAAELKEGTAPNESPGLQEAGPQEAAPKETSAPEENPDFQSVVKRTKEVAAKARSHAPAKAKSAEAQAAAAGPSNEVASKAAAGQVQAMSQTQPRPFDRAAFKAALMEKIASITPKNLDDAEKFKGSGKIESVKKDLTSKVKESKEQSQGEVKEKVEQEPDKSGIEPKKVISLPPAQAGSMPGDVGASKAAPKPAPESDVSLPLQRESQGLDSTMSKEGVTEEQLDESNEPSFKSALAEKRNAQEDASQRPQEFRKEEQEVVAQASSEMATSAKAEVTSLHQSRVQQITKVAGLQVNAKGKDEQERAKVANHVQEIYSQTKGRVENRLKKLDDDVNAAFYVGAMVAEAAFGDYVDKELKAYKEKRYSDITGKALWVRDLFKGLPAEVNSIYIEGKRQYTSKMDKVLDGIVTIIETGLNQAKDIIAQGKKEIQGYINSQPESLRSVAEEAAQGIQDRFDDLEKSVDDKQNQLIDSLAKKYVESQQKIDARIKKMQEANKGLIAKAKESLKGVVEAIRKLKSLLDSALSKAANVIALIIQHPIKFLGNLVAGVKQGLQNFMGKIGHYLMEGLMAWLFGTMAEAGIRLPESFDLKGLLSLVLQVLGLTYENIRARAVKIVGEKVVGTLEKTAGIFYDVITKGPGVLWDWIKDKLGDLKSMILEPIKSFVQEKIIVAGITWLLGLLNPVGAFIKAIKAIYDIIMFFVERASQIMALVNAIIDSIMAIALGNISVAANMVEKALAKAIPVAIGFLAALLGIGGIGQKIKSVVETIRVPIDKAIDWAINITVKASGKIKSLFTGTKDKGETPENKVADEGTKATVKAEALEDLRSRIMAKPAESFEELQGTVNKVFDDYSPRGLRSIRLNLSDEKSLKINLVASASDPERRTIYWKDIFAKGDPIGSEHKAEFEKQGFETYAALSIDGKGIAIEENSSNGHAEQVLLNKHWKKVLELIRDKASKGKLITVVIAINRTPCGECTMRLLDAIAEARRDPLINEYTRFILAPTGLYEPSEKLTPAEMAEQMRELELQAKRYGRPLERIAKQQLAKVRSGAGTTSMGDLGRLVAAGWDLHQLIARKKPTTSGNILGEVAHRLNAQLDRIEANR